MPTDNENTNKNANDHSSTQKVVDTAAKGAAEYFAPGVGAKVYDVAKKTPIVGNQLNKATQRVAKKIDRVPGAKKLSQGLNRSGAINAANQGINMMGRNKSSVGTQNQAEQSRSATAPEQNTQEGVEKQGSTPLLNSKNESKKSNAGKAETDGGKATDLFGKIKKYKTYFQVGCGALGCLGLVFVIVFLVISLKYVGDLFKMDSILGGVSEFVDDVANTFSGCWFQSEEKCQDIQRDKFFEEVEKVYNTYKEYGVELDTALIVATLTYKDMENILPEEEEGEEYEYGQENIELGKIDASDYRKMRKVIDALADHMAPYELGPTGLQRQLDIEAYKQYLLTYFIYWYYYPYQNLEEIQTKIQQTVKEIFERKSFYEDILASQTSLTTVSAMCLNGITVVNSNGDIVGNYGLETYVAGVVSGEAYAGYPEDAYKAQAIAARTYALYYTNNCTKPIVNTSAAQVFKEDILEHGRIGAESTAGMVLTYDGKIFAAQYDSFCTDDDRCPDAYYDDATDSYIVTYTKLPDGSTHKISISADFAGKFTHQGHAHGMSQLKSYEMAENGDDYKTILKYFYSDGVEIRNMNAVFAGNIGQENGKDGQIEVIDGVFHLPKDSSGRAGTEGTKGGGTIYNAGYNAIFEARLEAFRLAAEQAGHKIIIPTGENGAWRPYDRQKYYYDCYINKNCNNGNSASYPGYGQHGWGIAADLGYGSQAAITWAHAHAIEFDLHFPVASENWHIEPTRIERDL